MAADAKSVFSFRSFACCVCTQENFGAPIPIHQARELAVNYECATEIMVPSIENALRNEFDFPPRWGSGITLEYQHCLHLLPEGFEKTNKTKEFKYRSPIALRIYCQVRRQTGKPGSVEVSAKFLGQRCNDPQRAMMFQCPREDEAKGSCTYCGDILPYSERAYVECVCPSADEHEANAFEGLLRGRHYQIRPNKKCGLKVELREVCNRLICASCTCCTHFCAICGEPTKHGSGHWNLGMPCPMYYRSSDKNGRFDPPAPGAQGVPAPIQFNLQQQLSIVLGRAGVVTPPALVPRPIAQEERPVFRQSFLAPGVRMDIPGTKPIRISLIFVAKPATPSWLKSSFGPGDETPRTQHTQCAPGARPGSSSAHKRRQSALRIPHRFDRFHVDYVLQPQDIALVPGRKHSPRG